MMVNIGTRVATVNIVFSTSRNAAVIERKLLQYTMLSNKLQRCTLNELKTHTFYIVKGLCLNLNTMCGPETTLKPGISTSWI